MFFHICPHFQDFYVEVPQILDGGSLGFQLDFDPEY